MSRTYRRTWKGYKTDWLPGIHYDELKDVFYSWRLTCDAGDWLDKNPNRRHDVENHFRCLYTTPSHWHHDYHTIPRRAKERQLVGKIKSGYLDADDVTFPDGKGKKPYIYYW